MAGGRPTKTLLERVSDNSFRPGRYGHLLAGEVLPAEPPPGFRNRRRRRVWALLRECQQAWQASAHSAMICAQFAELVRVLHGGLDRYALLEPAPNRHDVVTDA
jgi:hypothetical protein